MDIDSIEENYKQEQENAREAFFQSVQKGVKYSEAEISLKQNLNQSRTRYYEQIGAYIKKDFPKTLLPPTKKTLKERPVRPFVASRVKMAPSQKEVIYFKLHLFLIHSRLFFKNLHYMLYPSYLLYLKVRLRKKIQAVNRTINRAINATEQFFISFATTLLKMAQSTLSSIWKFIKKLLIASIKQIRSLWARISSYKKAEVKSQPEAAVVSTPESSSETSN